MNDLKMTGNRTGSVVLAARLSANGSGFNNGFRLFFIEILLNHT
ncbi:MAG: hypothetical protein WBJ46_00925 [Rectinema sp.]